MKCLAIYSWARIFEPSVTKDATAGITLPIKRGLGFAKLMAFPDGVQAYGAFIALLPLALNCVPRGTLTYAEADGVKPHDAASIAIITGMPVTVVQAAIDLLLTVGWLEWVETDTAVPKGRTVKLKELLEELGAKTVYQGGSILHEWEAAVKHLKPNAVRHIFGSATPGILYPSQFAKHRKEHGI